MRKVMGGRPDPQKEQAIEGSGSSLGKVSALPRCPNRHSSRGCRAVRAGILALLLLHVVTLMRRAPLAIVLVEG